MSLTISAPVIADTIQHAADHVVIFHIDADAPAHTVKPVYVPTYFERKDGYFEDGVFHCPRYAIFKNGERVLLGGKIKTAYPHGQANHILMHLQELSDKPSSFTLEPVSWQPMADYEISLGYKGVSA